VPVNVDRQWRPYTYGRWAYTGRYGWRWNSDKQFGWATYHCGRWGFSSQVGWFWVPGSRWGPAWVSWRSSDNYLAWAPLPPSYDEDVSINIRVETVPDYYWQVVPTGHSCRQIFRGTSCGMNLAMNQFCKKPVR